MTEKRVDLLTDAIQLAFDGKKVLPIIGYLTKDGQTQIDFSVDVLESTIACDKVHQFFGDVEKVRRFCDNLNARNIIEENVDEAVADERKVVGMLAKAIKAEDYETIYDFIEW